MRLLKGTKGKTFGSAWMFKALIVMLRTINIKVFYAFMAICVIPVTMVFSSGARLAFTYYHRRRNYGWWKSLRATYKNHCLFGQTVIDKFAMYAGHKFQIAYQGLEDYNRLLDCPEAFIQLSAHIGCSEILGYSLHLDKPCGNGSGNPESRGDTLWQRFRARDQQGRRRRAVTGPRRSDHTDLCTGGHVSKK